MSVVKSAGSSSTRSPPCGRSRGPAAVSRVVATAGRQESAAAAAIESVVRRSAHRLLLLGPDDPEVAVEVVLDHAAVALRTATS